MSRAEQYEMHLPQHGTLTIVAGQPEDVEVLAGIGEDVMAWQRSQGIDPGRLPRPLLEIVARRLRAGGIYLAKLAGTPVATVTLLAEAEEMWEDLPGDALYLHGLMVLRRYAGRDIGQTLLVFAERRAAALGKPLLRLDCNATSSVLCSYYERAGFVHRGNVALPERTAARYEKHIEEQSHHVPDPL